MEVGNIGVSMVVSHLASDDALACYQILLEREKNPPAAILKLLPPGLRTGGCIEFLRHCLTLLPVTEAEKIRVELKAEIAKVNDAFQKQMLLAMLVSTYGPQARIDPEGMLLSLIADTSIQEDVKREGFKLIVNCSDNTKIEAAIQSFYKSVDNGNRFSNSFIPVFATFSLKQRLKVIDELLESGKISSASAIEFAISKWPEHEPLGPYLAEPDRVGLRRVLLLRIAERNRDRSFPVSVWGIFESE